MINLMIGAPGGGKSYEAVVFHVLPALKKGRKVITNLPLVVEKFGEIDPSYPDLLELRRETKAVRKPGPKPFRAFAFAHIEDYQDKWRHPETGSGPLYVIDEAHECLPRTGTPEDVRIWYAMARHESVDVLLLTQSYRKVDRDVYELAQLVYRVRKAVALGSSNKYIKKVQDGVKGAVVNETIREYKAQYFGLYKSHTRGGGAEMGAEDVKPFWRHWSVIGAGLAFVVGLGVLGYGLSGYVGDKPKPQAKAPAAPAAAPAKVEPTQVQPSTVGQGLKHAGEVVAPMGGVSQGSRVMTAGPYAGLTIHVLGRVTSGKRWVYLMMSSVNGQPLKTFAHTELEEAGYVVEQVSGDVARVKYDGQAVYVLSDAPQVSIRQTAAAGRVPDAAGPGASRGEPQQEHASAL